MTNDESLTRRTVIRLAAASSGLALVAGCGGPGEEGGSEDDGEPQFEEGTGNGQERENETGEGEDEGTTEANGEDNESEGGTANESDGGAANESDGDAANESE